MKTVVFHTPQLDVRGTCVSLYDYAHYNEKILGNKSIILVPQKSNNDQLVVKKFLDRFNQIVYYDTLEDMEDKIKNYDVLYTIKYGKKDELVSKNIKTVIHCVFDLSEPHGDVYAAVSETLAKKFGKDTWVPHMIGLDPELSKDNMREDLGIPKDAIVFGRHGGQDTFDLDIAKNAIRNLVNDRYDIYFIFVNTPVFYNHPNIKYLNRIVDLKEKSKFINTCDAMIHAQSLGETFGISIGEFSVNNKPIITYGGPVWNDNYKKILGNNALYYNSEEECYNTMYTFKPKEYENKDNNYYREYSPEKVMEIFDKIFLKS